MSIGIVGILYGIQRLIRLLIFVRIILSFLPNVDPSHPLVRFIHNATEPLLAPFRAVLPATRIGLDFSPILALFVIDLVFRLLINVFH